MATYNLFIDTPTKYCFIADFNEYACWTTEFSLYVLGENNQDYEIEEGDKCRYPFLKAYRDKYGDEDCCISNILDGEHIADPGDDGYNRSPVDMVPAKDCTIKQWKFNSIGIFLSKKPNKKQLNYLNEAVNDFAKQYHELALYRKNPIKLLGTRLIEYKTVMKEV